LLGLACILALLESLHAFIKFAKMKDVFVCDLVVVIKVCLENILWLDFKCHIKQNLGLQIIIGVETWEYPNVVDTQLEFWSSTFVFSSKGHDIWVVCKHLEIGDKKMFCCWIVGEKPMQK